MGLLKWKNVLILKFKKKREKTAVVFCSLSRALPVLRENQRVSSRVEKKKKWKCHQFVNKALNFATLFGTKGVNVKKKLSTTWKYGKKRGLACLAYYMGQWLCRDCLGNILN